MSTVLKTIAGLGLIVLATIGLLVMIGICQMMAFGNEVSLFATAKEPAVCLFEAAEPVNLFAPASIVSAGHADGDIAANGDGIHDVALFAETPDELCHRAIDEGDLNLFMLAKALQFASVPPQKVASSHAEPTDVEYWAAPFGCPPCRSTEKSIANGRDWEYNETITAANGRLRVTKKLGPGDWFDDDFKKRNPDKGYPFYRFKLPNGKYQVLAGGTSADVLADTVAKYMKSASTDHLNASR